MIARAAVCNTSGSGRFTVVYPKNVAQRNQIVVCDDCGLMYAYPIETRNVDRYLESGRVAEQLTDETPSIIRSFDKLADYLPISDVLEGMVPEKGTLLEVGCHAGVLLDAFRQRGWRVLGIEPDDSAARFARDHFGIDVEATVVESSKVQEGSLDAVLMLHVIEHLDDPSAAVAAVHRLLRPGGVLVVETPSYDSIMFRILGRRERNVSCSGHIFFYTTNTLRQLLGRHGFEVIREGKVGRTVSLGQLLWNVGAMTKSGILQRQVDRVTKAFDLGRRGRLHLNAHDIVRVYARKRASSLLR